MSDHGTPGRYNAGCHCETCRKGNAVRNARYRTARQGKTPPTHGYAAYVNWGCRCDVCTKDWAEAYDRFYKTGSYSKTA